QDKMTANINNKVITTNTAEDGATQFLNWFGGRFKTGGSGWPDESVQATVWQGNMGNGLIPYTNPERNDVSNNIRHGQYYWVDTEKTITTTAATTCSNPCWDDDNHRVIV